MERRWRYEIKFQKLLNNRKIDYRDHDFVTRDIPLCLSDCLISKS